MARTYSKSSVQYRRTNRCPVCNRFLWYTRDFVDGREVSPIRLNPPDDPAAVVQCPKCDARWFAYDRSAIFDVVETHRTSEVIADQEIVMDNTGGRTSMLRTKTITHEWRQTYEVTVEEGRTVESGVQVGTAGVVSVSALAQNTLKSTYGVVEETARSYAEEIHFDVPAGVRQTLTLTFRRIWQHGTITVTDGDGDVRQLPFKVAIDVEMDMKRVDA